MSQSDNPKNHPSAEDGLGETPFTVLVHKTDAEGALTLDAKTGQVKLSMEQPDWGNGLVCALLFERHEFYTQRLGKEYTGNPTFKSPEALVVDDLSWIIVDEDTGEQQERAASADYRQTVLAEHLGIDLGDVDQFANLGQKLSEGKGNHTVEAEIAMDQTRSEQEANALADAWQQGFTTLPGETVAEAARRTAGLSQK